ncbi:MAG: winged helix-turn-helix transcriptional regulator [Candidatus Hodarchaeota archaeon]
MLITPEEYQIILKLESNPLISYSDLADELGVSWPTAKKRLDSLKSQGIIRTPVSIYNAKALGLQRITVIWALKSLKELSFLEKLCDLHPYTHYRVRGYGDGYVLLAQFNVPSEALPLMEELIERTVEKKYADKANLLISTGYRVETFPDLKYYDLMQNKWEFDWFNWIKGIDDQPAILPKQDDFKASDLRKWKPIDFTILRELTKNPEVKQAELMRSFNLSRTNAHLLYNSVFTELISSLRLRFNRILFKLVNTRLYWIPKPNEKKTNQLFNLITKKPPPFHLGIDILQERGLLLWGGALPNFHEHQLALIIWNLFQDFFSFTIDTSVDMSMIYWFYPDNFDFNTHYWKIDREYVVETPLNELRRRQKEIRSTLEQYLE